MSLLASGVSAISAGLENTCAVKDGAVWCWGAATGSSVPVAVAGLENGVSEISTGRRHFCAVKDTTIWCWGANDKGQLGNGTTSGSDLPVAVTGLGTEVSAASPADAVATASPTNQAVRATPSPASGVPPLTLPGVATELPSGFGTDRLVRIISVDPVIGANIDVPAQQRDGLLAGRPDDPRLFSVVVDYQAWPDSNLLGWSALVCQNDAGAASTISFTCDERGFFGGMDVVPNSAGTVVLGLSSDVTLRRSMIGLRTPVTLCQITVKLGNLGTTSAIAKTPLSDAPNCHPPGSTPTPFVKVLSVDPPLGTTIEPDGQVRVELDYRTDLQQPILGVSLLTQAGQGEIYSFAQATSELAPVSADRTTIIVTANPQQTVGGQLCGVLVRLGTILPPLESEEQVGCH